MTLSRRAAAVLSALVLSVGATGCADAGSDVDVREPGGAAPGGEEKNAPDGGEVEPPD